MAIVTDNDILLGLRGRFGDMVFRSMNGKTMVSRKPGKQDPQKQSEARKKTRSNFREASAWAVEVRRNPEVKAYYQQLAREWELTNGYIAAIRDYMRNPDVVTKFAVESPVQSVDAVDLQIEENTIVSEQLYESKRMRGSTPRPLVVIGQKVGKVLREVRVNESTVSSTRFWPASLLRSAHVPEVSSNYDRAFEIVSAGRRSCDIVNGTSSLRDPSRALAFGQRLLRNSVVREGTKAQAHSHVDVPGRARVGSCSSHYGRTSETDSTGRSSCDIVNGTSSLRDPSRALAFGQRLLRKSVVRARTKAQTHSRRCSRPRACRKLLFAIRSHLRNRFYRA